MNIEQVVDRLNKSFSEYKPHRNIRIPISRDEYETIKTHIEAQQEEIDCGDRNAGDANDLIHKQCLENDRLKAALNDAAEFFDILECDEEAQKIRELLK